jgi:hypothetical protein
MSNENFYTWVLPFGLAAFGWAYAFWARWTYARHMDRWEREQAVKKPAAAGE